jgi:multicomponent Na+:H+ antiporter subunit B
MLSFLVFFIAIVSISLIIIKDTLSVVVIFGLISILSTLFYVFNLAPDVAITEAAVGSAISTIFFIMTIAVQNKIPNKKNNKIVIIMIAILCFILFLILVYLTIKLQKYGNSNNIIHGTISQYYIANTGKNFGIPNIVTAILGGYRGLDTLFETTVIFAAAMGARSILSKND